MNKIIIINKKVDGISVNVEEQTGNLVITINKGGDKHGGNS